MMRRNTLEVYISEGCWSCQETEQILADVAPEFPDIAFEVRDLSYPKRPEAVFAVPTYLLNGRVIFLGNPTREQLSRKLGLVRQKVK